VEYHAVEYICILLHGIVFILSNPAHLYCHTLHTCIQLLGLLLPKPPSSFPAAQHVHVHTRQQRVATRNAHLRTCTHAGVNTQRANVHVRAYAQTQTYRHIDKCTCVYSYTRARIHTHTHTHTRTSTHTHTHTHCECEYIYTYTHKCVCVCVCACLCVCVYACVLVCKYTRYLIVSICMHTFVTCTRIYLLHVHMETDSTDLLHACMCVCVRASVFVCVYRRWIDGWIYTHKENNTCAYMQYKFLS